MNLWRRHRVEFCKEATKMQEAAMNGIDLVEKLAEMQRQYADAHRPVRSIQAYRERHARHHPERDYDGERHVSKYRPRP
jgi:hypothetical protein